MARHVSGLEVSRYADGELAPKATAWLETHIAVCADCRARVRDELMLGADLRTHFSAAGSNLPAVMPRHAWRPFGYAAVAAAALIMGVMVAPQLAGDVELPQTPAGSVNAYTLYVHVGNADTTTYTTVQGFVVASSQGTLHVRVGAQVLKVNLPAGYSAASYPVGAAVVVQGVPQGPNAIEAAAIQRIEP